MHPGNPLVTQNYRFFAQESKKLELDASIDYYKVLGVTYGATDESIKKNFYDLAKKYHPDSNDE